mgnify:CR=1 FL=1
MSRMRVIKSVVILMLMLAFVACMKVENTNEFESEDDDREVEIVLSSRIKLSFDDRIIVVEMLDNPSANDFLNLLPIELSFEDYNQTERIAYLLRQLSSDDEPMGMTPRTGDFTYYRPWGNLAIFYNDFSYSSGLIPLGKIVEGLNNVKKINKNTIVKIETID